MTYLVITEDGKMFPFDPSEWAWLPNLEDLKAGTYEPKAELVKAEGDSYAYRLSQLMPQLVRVRSCEK